MQHTRFRLPLRTIGLICSIAMSMPGSVSALPAHDAIPPDFQGTYAVNQADCADPDGVDLIQVASDGIHYYEADDYLLIGIAFSGSSTKSGRSVPLFNGRFTGRSEARLLGEANARLEMETPTTLIRYTLGQDGEPEPGELNTWLRCAAAR